MHQRLLTASVEDRTLSYRLLPYGEEGRTNLGRVTASAGALTIPDDVAGLSANLEHERTRPVAKFVAVTEDEDGLTATFRVARTSAGDDLLAEAAEGLRTGVSVEVDNPIIRGGRLLAGVLAGAGFVVSPAFPSALLLAADAGDLPDAEQETEDEDTESTSTDAAPSAESEDTVSETLNAAAPAAAPQGLQAAAVKNTNRDKSADDVFKMLAAEFRAGGEQQLQAALSNVTAGNILGIEVPQYVGELWSGRAYQRKIVPLFNSATLSSYEVKGWRWTTKPAVAAYGGFPAQPTSGSIATAQVTISAERIAGAHAIDRKFKDFGDSEFYAAYYRAMTESYAQVSDAAVLADVLTAAGSAVEVGTVPTGVSEGLVKILDGALQILDDANAVPTFAVVATDVWREIALTREQDRLAFLNAGLGLEEGQVANFRIVPNAGIAAGHVLVGAREAVTVHELGGGAPIRVEAESIGTGGVESGVFGYYAVNVHDDDALVLVGPAVP